MQNYKCFKNWTFAFLVLMKRESLKIWIVCELHMNMSLWREEPVRRPYVQEIYDFTSPYDRWPWMMRVLEGVNARTEMAENVDQVVGLGGRTLIILCYALGLKLRNDKLDNYETLYKNWLLKVKFSILWSTS